MGRAEARQRDPRLDAVDRDIMNVIDRRTFLGYGDGRVGVKVLAEQVHRTTRTVRRHLARLEALGYVEVQERQHCHGGPAVNLYRVCSPKDRGPVAFASRRRARQERDAARKAPRRSRRGVLTRTSPPPIRGRENARTGTGEQRRGRPAVPAGRRTQLEVRAMDAERRAIDTAARSASGGGEVERWTPGEVVIRPVRRVPYSETEAGLAEVADAQARIAALVARRTAALGGEAA